MIRMAIVLLAALALACPARAENEMKKNPFGVLEFLHWNHDWNNFQYPGDAELEKAARMMRDVGVGMVRMDFLWQDVEPRRGEFDFARYDRIVDILSANGIEILGILDYSADWASPTGQWNDPAEDNSAFVAYAARVAGRYKDRVRYWEIWNEPDSPVYWKRQDSLAGYCRLLREAYAALKAVDPGCTVLNGGLTYELSKVNQLYDNGGKGYFDALNIHIFENPCNPGPAEKRVSAYVRACARIMARNGDGDKKIWVTETGCPGVRRGVRVRNCWMGKSPTEIRQAGWVSAVYTALLARKEVRAVFWAFFRDTDNHWKDGTDYMGLVRNDFTPKPAYTAYRDAHRAWAGRVKERE